MSRTTENTIKNFCIELLEKQGYETIYTPDIAFFSEIDLEINRIKKVFND